VPGCDVGGRSRHPRLVLLNPRSSEQEAERLRRAIALENRQPLKPTGHHSWRHASCSGAGDRHYRGIAAKAMASYRLAVDRNAQRAFGSTGRPLRSDALAARGRVRRAVAHFLPCGVRLSGWLGSRPELARARRAWTAVLSVLSGLTLEERASRGTRPGRRASAVRRRRCGDCHAGRWVCEQLAEEALDAQCGPELASQ
jgi:hypothetical protein